MLSCAKHMVWKALAKHSALLILLCLANFHPTRASRLFPPALQGLPRYKSTAHHLTAASFKKHFKNNTVSPGILMDSFRWWFLWNMSGTAFPGVPLRLPWTSFSWVAIMTTAQYSIPYHSYVISIAMTSHFLKSRWSPKLLCKCYLQMTGAQGPFLQAARWSEFGSIPNILSSNIIHYLRFEHQPEENRMTWQTHKMQKEADSNDSMTF